MTEYLKYAAILIILCIVQRTLVWLIAVTSFEITPDIVLVGVVYISIKKGKITGSIGGFLSGLFIDVLSFSFVGLMAMSKSVAGFISGFFNDENKVGRYLSTYVFVTVVFFCSLANNLIYYTIYFQGTTQSFTEILLKYIIPTAVYTSVIGVIAVIFSRKRKR